MLQAIGEQFQTLLGLGLDVGDVGAVQMALRTIIIYVCSLAIIRIGSKRVLSQASAFDVIVAIMLGSVMSRAIGTIIRSEDGDDKRREVWRCSAPPWLDGFSSRVCPNLSWASFSASVPAACYT